jgi:hypothetical protein
VKVVLNHCRVQASAFILNNYTGNLLSLTLPHYCYNFGLDFEDFNKSFILESHNLLFDDFDETWVNL